MQQSRRTRNLLMFLAIVLAISTTTAVAQSEPPPAEPSPYVSFQEREIKALSEDEISSLRAGKGMGFALAAELNRHPGPKHVLELAQELALTEAQVTATRAAFDAMHRKAVALGERVIAKEAELDARFASGEMDQDALEAIVSEIAAMRGGLRVAHLEAHLSMRTILSPEQVAGYDVLRGYREGHEPPANCPHGEAGHQGP